MTEFINPTVSVFPFVNVGDGADTRAGELCRGLAWFVEQRLRVVPGFNTFLQQMIVSPEGAPEQRTWMTPPKMWTLEQAVALPAPGEAEVTHLVQGELKWAPGGVEFLLEAIDREKKFACFHHKLATPEAEFIPALTRMLGDLAAAIAGDLEDSVRKTISAVPTKSFAAFGAHLVGLSQVLANGVQIAGATPADALKQFVEAIELDPFFEEACFGLNMIGREHLWRESRQAEPALAAMTTCARLAPAFMPFKETLGHYLFEHGRLDEAAPYLEEFVGSTIRDATASANAMVRLALIRHRDGDTARSHALLHDALRRQPENIGALETLALSHHQQGQLATAEHYWRRVLDIAPTHPTALSHMGAIYREKKQPERARIVFQRSIEGFQPPSDAFERAVKFFLETSALEDADRVSTEWAEQQEDNPRAWLAVAETRRRRGQLHPAEFALAKAEALPGAGELGAEIALARLSLSNAVDFGLFVRLAGALGRLERGAPPAGDTSLDQLVPVAKSLADRHPGVPALWQVVVELLVRAAQPSLAASAQERVVALLPGALAQRLRLATLRKDAGDLAGAAAALEGAVALAPRDFAARLACAEALLDSGRREDAHAQLDAAEAIRAGDARVAALRSRAATHHAEAEARDDEPDPRPGGVMRRLASWMRRERD